MNQAGRVRDTGAQLLFRQLVFTGIILAIEIPLGVAIALTMSRKGPWVSVCLVLMALPLLIPWNVVGAIWNVFALPEIGLFGQLLNSLSFGDNYTRQRFAPWFTLILMNVWHWTSLVVLLAYAGLSSIADAYCQAAKIDSASRWAVYLHDLTDGFRAFGITHIPTGSTATTRRDKRDFGGMIRHRNTP